MYLNSIKITVRTSYKSPIVCGSSKALNHTFLLGFDHSKCRLKRQIGFNFVLLHLIEERTVTLFSIIYDRFLLSTKKKRYRKSGIKDRKIGDTPLIRLFNYSSRFDRLIYAKMECENPTRSAKDRVAQYVLNKAIQEGKIDENTVVIEASSGNTGLALARLANKMGIKCTITIKDKVSATKISDLKRLGAKVIVCPSSAPRSSEENYITKAEHLEKTLEGAFYVNQNFNPDNANAHYHSTGPEIWQQTGGSITHLVGAIGTGGTLSGTARYIKEQNPNVKVIAIDARGSVLKSFGDTGQIDEEDTFSYNMDGVGKKFIPSNVQFDLFDEIIQISDLEAYQACVELNESEKIYVGHSSGAVMQGIKEMVHSCPRNACVVGIFPDHGSKYEKSIFDPNWLKKKGFISE